MFQGYADGRIRGMETEDKRYGPEESANHQMIKSQLEILKQGENLLRDITEDQFTWKSTEHSFNSIGKHFRHIIDHYQSLREATLTGILDYDHRSRGCDIESNPESALNAWLEISHWMEELPEEKLGMPMQLSTEISIHEETVRKVDTCLERELIYLGNHTVHHFAVISLAMSIQGRKLDDQFSLAPATATHLRKQQSAK
jgi:hypothetical protein